MRQSARRILFTAFALALSLFLLLPMSACENQTGTTAATGAALTAQPSPAGGNAGQGTMSTGANTSGGTGANSSATGSLSTLATTANAPTPTPTPMPTVITAATTATTAASSAAATPTPTPTPTPTKAPTVAPTSTLNVLKTLDCVFMSVDWGDYQHMTVRALKSTKEYDFWVLKDTGVNPDSLITGDQIKVTWRTTNANIPEAGGLLKIDEAVKIEYLVRPPVLQTLDCTFVSYVMGDYMHITVKPLTSLTNREFWVLGDTGVRPQAISKGARIRLTWRTINYYFPESGGTMKIDQAVKIAYLR